MQSKIKINNPQKAELQIATLLFLCLWDNEPAAYGLGKESAMTKHNAEMENSSRLHFGSCKAFISVARMIA